MMSNFMCKFTKKCVKQCFKYIYMQTFYVYCIHIHSKQTLIKTDMGMNISGEGKKTMVLEKEKGGIFFF